MDDRSRVFVSACLGALVGGIAGYLYLTENGRRMRERLEPGMDEMVREMRRLRGAVDAARLAAREGWAAVEDLRRGMPESSGFGTGRPPTPF